MWGTEAKVALSDIVDQCLGFARAVMHKLPLLFLKMLGTWGHAPLQSIAPSKLIFSFEKLFFMKEPQRVPREGLNGHNDLQCLSKGPCQSPADASSTRIYLAPVFSAEKASIFIAEKHLLFNFLYPAGSMQWEDLFFFLGWPVLTPLPWHRGSKMPSFSLSPCVKGTSTALVLRHFKCFLFSFGPRSTRWMQTPKKIRRQMYSKYNSCCFLLPCLLLLLQ